MEIQEGGTFSLTAVYSNLPYTTMQAVFYDMYVGGVKIANTSIPTYIGGLTSSDSAGAYKTITPVYSAAGTAGRYGTYSVKTSGLTSLVEDSASDITCKAIIRSTNGAITTPVESIVIRNTTTVVSEPATTVSVPFTGYYAWSETSTPAKVSFRFYADGTYLVNSGQAGFATSTGTWVTPSTPTVGNAYTIRFDYVSGTAFSGSSGYFIPSYPSYGVDGKSFDFIQTGVEVNNTGTYNLVITGPGGTYTKQVSIRLEKQPGQSSCFVPGSQVTLINGSTVAIEELEVGMVVLGQNGLENTVLDIYKHEQSIREIYTVNDFISMTAAHPVLTTTGWKAIDQEAALRIHPELDIQTLEIGDTLIKVDAAGNEIQEEVTTITVDEIDTHTYNLNVTGNDTYIVNDLIVHNK